MQRGMQHPHARKSHAAALAMLGESERFDVFAKLKTPAFPGGRLFRWPILVLAMSWFALRDRIG